MDAKGYSRIPRELCYWITFLAEALPLSEIRGYLHSLPAMESEAKAGRPQ